MCDHPDATFFDYVDEVLQPTIDRCGWAVQAVGGSRIHAPFAYTVGLTRSGLPELVVTGKTAGAAQKVLNELAQADLVPGEQLTHDGQRFEAVELPHPEAHLFVATGLYGTVAAQQLVWADERGRWPWERGHRGGRGGQPVLGPRSLPQRRAG